MDKDKIPYAIEGILFAAGEPVKTAKLAAVLEIDIQAVDEAVRILKYEYDTQERGFMIIDIDEGYQICSRPEYYNYIQITTKFRLQQNSDYHEILIIMKF